MAVMKERAQAWDLVDPTGRLAAGQKQLAPRLATLTGSVIGLLDNRKGNADHVLEGVAQALLAVEPTLQFVRIQKRIFSRPAEEAVLAELRRCTAVIEAIGD